MASPSSSSYPLCLRHSSFVIRHFATLILCAQALTSAVAAPTDTAPLLSPIFGDHMVLQRGKPNTFWGWAKPGEEIRVEIAGHAAKANAAADGRWEAQITPPTDPGPHTVTIALPGETAGTLELHDVLVGDVWLCGGQSNMELPLSRVRNAEAEIAAANHPQIRLFTVKSHAAYSPSSQVQGSWKVCSPKTVAENGGFSAVGYFFARKIQTETNVPIALLQDCLGGSRINK